MEKEVVINALAALAQETRLDIFRLLVRAGPVGLAAGTIAEAVGIPSATLSFHLKELKNAGLALCKRTGRSLIYSPNFAAVEGIMRFLTENCCQGASCERTRG